MGKHFTKLVKFASNFRKFVEFATNFMKFIEFANNFTKFVGLAKNFYKVRRNCETFSSWESPITFAKSVRSTKTL